MSLKLSKDVFKTLSDIDIIHIKFIITNFMQNIGVLLMQYLLLFSYSLYKDMK